MTCTTEAEAAMDAIRVFTNRQLRSSLSDPEHQKRSKLPRADMEAVFDSPEMRLFSFSTDSNKLRASIMEHQTVPLRNGGFALKRMCFQSMSEDEVKVQKVKLVARFQAGTSSSAPSCENVWTLYAATDEGDFWDLAGYTKCWTLLKKCLGFLFTIFFEIFRGSKPAVCLWEAKHHLLDIGCV